MGQDTTTLYNFREDSGKSMEYMLNYAQMMGFLKGIQAGEHLYIQELMGQVQSMEKQIRDLNEQMQTLGKKAKAEKKPELGKIYDRTVQKGRSLAESLGRLKDYIVDKSQEFMAYLKMKGKSAALSFLKICKIEDRLEKIQGDTRKLIQGLDQDIRKLDELEMRMRRSGTHIKNAGRVLAGKEEMDPSASRQYPTHVFSKFLISVKKFYENVLTKIEKALQKYRMLEHEVEQNRSLAETRAEVSNREVLWDVQEAPEKTKAELTGIGVKEQRQEAKEGPEKAEIKVIGIGMKEKMQEAKEGPEKAETEAAGVSGKQSSQIQEKKVWMPDPDRNYLILPQNMDSNNFADIYLFLQEKNAEFDPESKLWHVKPGSVLPEELQEKNVSMVREFLTLPHQKHADFNKTKEFIQSQGAEYHYQLKRWYVTPSSNLEAIKKYLTHQTEIRHSVKDSLEQNKKKLAENKKESAGIHEKGGQERGIAR